MTTRILSTSGHQEASWRSSPPTSAASVEYRELSMRFVNGYGMLDAQELASLHVRIRELWSLLEQQSNIFGK